MINTRGIHFQDMKWKGGAHLAFNGSISDSIRMAISMGMYSCQIYLGSPRSYNRSTIDKEDIKAVKDILKFFPVNLFIHTPVIYNLSGKVDNLAWQGGDTLSGRCAASNESDCVRRIGTSSARGDDIDKIMNLCVKGMQYELDVLNMIEVGNIDLGVVVHPGSNKDKENGLKAISETINKLEFKNGTGKAKLLLENSSGGGTKLATTFEEIKKIIDGVLPEKRENVGVCIDTAHIFGFGSYDLREKSEVDRMFREFDEIIGKEYLCLIHLNDSKCSEQKRHNAFFGSCKDCHQLLGEGYIWKDNYETLIYLLEICERRSTPIVLETVKEDIFTLASLNKFNK